MSRHDEERQFQYCKFCGAELVKVVEQGYIDPSEDRVSLQCPKKYGLRNWFSFKGNKHTEVFIEFVDTVLNFDPITGVRIKRDDRTK